MFPYVGAGRAPPGCRIGESRTGGRERAYAGGVPGASGRVLVVDDSQVIRQLIKINLELDGFEVMTAADGAECLEAVHFYRPRVITLDIAMPRLYGLRTAARLRLDARTRHVPLLLVSASAPGRGGLPGGIDAALSKPFEPAELVGLVRRLHDEGRPHAVPLAKCRSRTLAP